MNDERRKTYTFPFSPGDWLHDVALNRCSLAAQGLWMKMICIMHQGEPYGHLQVNGVPISMKELATMAGLDPKRGTERVQKWVQELDKMGVLSRTKNGIIYSRRMVRDESNRLINKQNGKKGGNPNLVNPVNPPVNPIAVALMPLPKSTPNTLVVSGETTPPKIPDKIPYDKLLATYNERRGALPQARGLTDGRKKKLRTRWNEHPDIAFWESVFVKAGKSEIMLKWASFDWLIKSEDNYTKTLDGNYDSDRDKKTVPRKAAAPMPREKDPDPKDLPSGEEVSELLDRAGFKRRKRGGGLTAVGVSPSIAVSEEELTI